MDNNKFLSHLDKDNLNHRKLGSFIKACKIDNLFKDKHTFLIPSSAMIKELQILYNDKKYTDLARKIMSLSLPNYIDNPKHFADKSFVTNNLRLNAKATKHNVELGKGVSASYKSTKDGVAVWKLKGDHIPELTKVKVDHKAGGFENPGSELKDNKFIELISKTIREKNGIKQVVCDLYNCADERSQKILDCLMSNPWAVLIFAIDNPLFKIDTDKFVNMTTTDAVSAYENLCAKQGDYVCNGFDKKDHEDIQSHLEGDSFIDQLIKEFYSEVAEDGSVMINDTKYQICHPELGKYWFKLELFYAYMDVLAAKIEKAIDEKNEKEFDDYLREMIIFNDHTNALSVEGTLMQLEKEPSESYQRFKDQYNRCGLRLFKKIEDGVVGSAEKKHKLKSRKIVKIKHKFDKLRPEEKKKIISYMSKN